jgi:hypothetical protein
MGRNALGTPLDPRPPVKEKRDSARKKAFRSARSWARGTPETREVESFCADHLLSVTEFGRVVRRVGEKTRQDHVSVARFRAKLTDFGHSAQIAVEVAVKAKWPAKAPAHSVDVKGLVLSRRRCYVMDQYGRHGVAAYMSAKGDFYVFRRLYAKGWRRLGDKPLRSMSALVAVPKSHILTPLH